MMVGRAWLPVDDAAAGSGGSQMFLTAGAMGRGRGRGGCRARVRRGCPCWRSVRVDDALPCRGAVARMATHPSQDRALRNAMQRPPSWSEQNAAAFQLDDVVEQYQLRAPYPSTLSPFLRDLALPAGGAVLELGCGTGTIARDLAPHVGRIDAVDCSHAMIERARTLRGGDHPAIRWIEGRAEDARLDGPYCLAIAGASLHWMDWDVVLPRVAGALHPGAVLAIVVSTPEPPPWNDQLREIWSRYSVIQNWENADLIALLESRGLYKQHQQDEAPSRNVHPHRWRIHRRPARDLESAAGTMGQDLARDFDREVRELVTPYARGDVLELAASAEVDVGRPLGLRRYGTPALYLAVSARARRRRSWSPSMSSSGMYMRP